MTGAEIPVAAAPDPLGTVDVARTSTVDQVARGLRDAILDGRLAPGTALRETSLAERLGVGRGTVREALRMLVSDGLVRHHPHRGAAVARLEGADVLDVFAARRVVEVAAAERAVGAAPHERSGLDDAVDHMRSRIEAGDVAGFVDAHAAFHRALVATLGSPRLARFFDTLQAELRLSFAVLDRLTGGVDDSVASHRALLSAIESGDPDTARRAILDHLEHGASDVGDLPDLVRREE